MFVVVSTYRAKIGEEDAIVALHEDWERTQGIKSKDYLSCELLRKVENPLEFIYIAHFASMEIAQASTKILEQNGWYSRLVSLIEGIPAETACTSEWQFRQ